MGRSFLNWGSFIQHRRPIDIFKSGSIEYDIMDINLSLSFIKI